MSNNNSSGGITLFGALGLIFIVLKISWRWWWVSAPWWILTVIALIIAAVVFTAAIIKDK